MPNHTEQSTSIWEATSAGMPETGPLRESESRYDVCVVGAGIAGLTTAYLLVREGRSVAVLEARSIGSGETGRTTGHLSFALDDRIARLQSLHGEEKAALAVRSHALAVELIEEIAREESISCDFKSLPGYLFLAEDDKPAVLEEELEAARRAGLEGVELEVGLPLGALTQTMCLRFPNQAQFHSLKYLAGLARAIINLGGKIFTDTRVLDVETGSPLKVMTDNDRSVLADHVVVATNSPITNRIALHPKLAPYRTYAIGIQIPVDTLPDALYWDTAHPYHYVRLYRDQSSANDPGFEVAIVGGEDHKTGQEETAGHFERLEKWAREYLADTGKVLYRWSGQVLEPVDGLAYIGRNVQDNENVYVVTGDSGHGLTHGTIAGRLISDLIAGRENPWAELYDPGRVSLKAAGTFVSENANVAVQYADWISGGEIETADDLKPGQGGLLRQGLTHIEAVYKAPDGQVTRRSAVCPHLGCVVHWNSVENTWDCPCHGSRFEATGEVISGPSPVGLNPAQVESA